MKEIKEELEKRGHEVKMPTKLKSTDYKKKTIGKGASNIIKYNLIKKHYIKILCSDAILVVNEKKDLIENYIGGNSFLEIGLAYVNNKKIFILNGLPKGINYEEEILGMQPIVLNGDLNKIQ